MKCGDEAKNCCEENHHTINFRPNNQVFINICLYGMHNINTWEMVFRVLYKLGSNALRR